MSAGGSVNVSAIRAACRRPRSVSGDAPGPFVGSPAFDSLCPCLISQTRRTVITPTD
ncbi:hypothetical protein GCM10009546_51650 [Actinomadura livida]|uniref:Uncharacterized protein n=1 Tax=Actinomadura livida TaxID=79909 RepID=A0ABP3Q4T8_9ACTN|nr:hypothetical protein GCM10010208_72360 [Actinomadura livida]